MEERENYNRYIRYQAALAKFFRELGLKANQINIIMAFLVVSKGESHFEASYEDLGKVFNKKTGHSRVDSKARNAFKGLEKWQEEHGIQLIQVIEKGHRLIADDGRFEYVKAQYQFVALEELLKIFHSNSEDLDKVIEKALANIKVHYQPVEKVKKYHPNHLIRKAKNTIFTKVGKIFEHAIEAGANPIEQCQRVLNECWQILSSLGDDWQRHESQNQFIKEFESKYKQSEKVENSKEISD